MRSGQLPPKQKSFQFLLKLCIASVQCIGRIVCRWVKDFLSEEQGGLDVLVSYMSSVLQQIVRSVLGFVFCQARVMLQRVNK